MNMRMWLGWSLLTLMMTLYFGYKLAYSDNKSEFLIGEATHGHHQIELACESCHTSPFGGPEVLQDACTNCHADELKEARDDHPRKKFTDPRNAALIEILDARQCISCHTEHQAEQTLTMGVTLPEDYCIHCHQDVRQNRPSHATAEFNSCATAGCHNFHDNRALYEDFLVEHSGRPWSTGKVQLPSANFAASKAPRGKIQSDQSFHLIEKFPNEYHAWAESKHAAANVQCVDCHNSTEPGAEWIDAPGIESCESCHQQEVTGFTAGKHGMRLSPKLSAKLSPMKPVLGKLAFHEDSLHAELTCNSCHDVHQPDTGYAASEACLGCHADEHSTSYSASPHGRLLQQEQSGGLPEGSGVSCATCHMPRIKQPGYADEAKSIPVYRVEHNQNSTLRPNEKMIRPVCLQCHSLEFSIDALADETLIKNNFNGQPSVHIESVDWALRRVKQ